MVSNAIVVLSILGSIASIIALLKDWNTRWIHVAYGLAFTILAFLLISSNYKLEEIKRIERQARNIANSSYLSSSGSQRGFMLAGLTFLEKYKDTFPDTYKRAVAMCDNVGITLSRPEGYIDRVAQDRKFDDGAEAMKSLLTGIAAGN